MRMSLTTLGWWLPWFAQGRRPKPERLYTEREMEGWVDLELQRREHNAKLAAPHPARTEEP